MQFDFYAIEAGTENRVQWRILAGAHLEAPPENAIAAVESQFQQLIASNADISSMIVVSRTIGNPPGAIVAAEEVSAIKPARRLKWLTDQSVFGL